MPEFTSVRTTYTAESMPRRMSPDATVRILVRECPVLRRLSGFGSEATFDGSVGLRVADRPQGGEY